MENASNQSTFVLTANPMATEHFYIHVHVHVGAVKHKPANCFSVSFSPFALHVLLVATTIKVIGSLYCSSASVDDVDISKNHYLLNVTMIN